MRWMLLAALLLAPLSQAQVFDEFSVNATSAEPITVQPDGSADIDVSVTLGCGTILGAGGEASVSLSADLPEWFGASASDVTFAAGGDCVSGSGSVTQAGKITLTPTADAFGEIDFADITITAAQGSATTTGTFAGPVQVAYQPGHTITPSVSFPLNVTGGKATFTVDIEVTANARSMVMFEELETTFGVTNGLQLQVFDIQNGDRTRTLTVTYEAPEGAWSNDSVSFTNFSHCLSGTDGTDCDSSAFQLIEEYNWEFINGSPGGESQGGDEGKESPGVGALLVLGLVGAALLRRR